MPDDCDEPLNYRQNECNRRFEPYILFMTFYKRPFPVIFFYALLALIVFNPDLAQSQTTSTATSADNTTSLSSNIAGSLESAEKEKLADPEAASAATAVDLLTRAAEKLRLHENATSATQEHQAAVREAPAALERVKLELQKDEATSTTAIEFFTTATAETLAQRADTNKAELAGLEERFQEVSAELLKRTTRIGEIPKEIVEAKQALSQAEIAAQSPSTGEDPAVAQARSLFAKAEMQAARSRIIALEEELNRYNAREELLPIAQKLIDQRIAAKKTLLKTLEDKLAEVRRVQATASARELSKAAQKADKSHPLVSAIASENTSITRQMDLGAVVDSHEEAVEKLAKVRQALVGVTEQYASLKSKFTAVGFSDALGILLRRQRNELPDLRNHRESLVLLESELAATNLKNFEVQDAVAALANPAERAAEIIAGSGLDPATTVAAVVQTEVADLLKARREYLVKVREANNNLFQTLIELNTAEEELVKRTADFLEFINQRILWLPSADRVSIGSVELAWQYVKSLSQSALWRDYFRAYVQRAESRPISSATGLIAFLTIIMLHRRWKIRLKNNLATAAKSRLSAFRPVILSLLYAALYSLPLPAALLAIGWPLANVVNVPLQISSLATGFVYGAISLFLLQVARKIIRRSGIASTFFGWGAAPLLKLRRGMALLAWVYVPASVLVKAADFNGSDASMEAARIILIIALLIAAFAIGWLMLPRLSVLAGARVYKTSSSLYRLRYPVFVLLLSAPLGLAVAAVMGYVYTAIELTQRLHITFWVAAFLLLFNETVFFWILVKRRRLAIQEVQRRREAAKASTPDGGTQVNPDGVVPVEPTIDIAAISQQAGRLLRTLVLGVFIVALWGVWAGVLPALRYLDSQPLWSVSRQVSETVVGGAVEVNERLVPVTVVDMLLVLLILFCTSVALRNIPGLLDITLFQKFSVQAGERYAFNTIIRYVIILIGIVYVFYLMGLQWKQLQWLAAAVSVGLGFGLQEIFANFVSGLILLFERPVRVGDFVSVGGIKGNITQIRIRATTVVDWDHFEHIIPNKEMITKPVENWTLSNLRRRLVIHIGVPYGCDYDQARDILLKVARENPYVLDDPEPAAGIEKLADSSVVFVVFAHLPNSDNFLGARHSLIAEFERQLSAVGIPIPFPQMEVHLETVAPKASMS